MSDKPTIGSIQFGPPLPPGQYSGKVSQTLQAIDGLVNAAEYARTVEAENDRLKAELAEAKRQVWGSALIINQQVSAACDFKEAALKAVDDEEELDGPMPDEVRAAFLQDPETSSRILVQLTKRNIRERIAKLPLNPNPSGHETPEASLHHSGEASGPVGLGPDAGAA